MILKMPVNIAIDGPAGAGKSSVAKALSAKLGYVYVDTGALYRAVALYAKENGTAFDDADGVKTLLAAADIGLKYENGEQRVYLNGADVTGCIRSPDISNGASAVSAIPEVRAFLLDLQKNIAARENVIMDGRDIGTVILPNADVKIFLTASPEERAKRRYLELSEKQPDCGLTLEEALGDINKRDYNDINKKISPLKQAEDAVLADTTNLGFDGAVEAVYNIVKEKLKINI